MGALSDYRQDIHRYVAKSATGWLRQVLTRQGLWALAQYRVASAIYRAPLPYAARRPLLLIMVAWQKLVEILTGISLPYTASIGPGLYIGHFGNIILNDSVVMGSGCNISQGVTLGLSGRGNRRGVPRIGDRVYIGANAVVVGDITVGSDSVIGANSLVRSDVPPGCTVLGVPAVVVSNRNSEEYIQ